MFKEKQYLQKIVENRTYSRNTVHLTNQILVCTARIPTDLQTEQSDILISTQVFPLQSGKFSLAKKIKPKWIVLFWYDLHLQILFFPQYPIKSSTK